MRRCIRYILPVALTLLLASVSKAEPTADQGRQALEGGIAGLGPYHIGVYGSDLRHCIRLDSFTKTSGEGVNIPGSEYYLMGFRAMVSYTETCTPPALFGGLQSPGYDYNSESTVDEFLSIAFDRFAATQSDGDGVSTVDLQVAVASVTGGCSIGLGQCPATKEEFVSSVKSALASVGVTGTDVGSRKVKGVDFVLPGFLRLRKDDSDTVTGQIVFLNDATLGWLAITVRDVEMESVTSTR